MMVYVLLALVVVLAIVCGAQYAVIKCLKAEYKAEVSTLKYAKAASERKALYMAGKNDELSKRLSRMNAVKEGLF